MHLRRDIGPLAPRAASACSSPPTATHQLGQSASLLVQGRLRPHSSGGSTRGTTGRPRRVSTSAYPCRATATGSRATLSSGALAFGAVAYASAAPTKSLVFHEHREYGDDAFRPFRTERRPFFSNFLQQLHEASLLTQHARSSSRWRRILLGSWSQAGYIPVPGRRRSMPPWVPPQRQR